MEEWEKRYIIREIQRFDQKNTMFNRPGWDQKINGLMDDWTMTGSPKEKAGFTLEERALIAASAQGIMIGLFNIDKPHPRNESVALMKRMAASGAKRPFSFENPDGLKIDESDPKALTDKIKKVARWFGADTVGICKLDSRWVYSQSYTEFPYQGVGDGTRHTSGKSIPQEIPEGFQYAIVMCYEMDYEMIQYYPTYLSVAPTSMGYSKMAITNHSLSGYIQNLGYRVINCTTNDVALSVPMAMQAGLGDIARNGLLVTPKYGPRVRISKVLTDLPMVPDSPIEFGVREFCEVCRICAERCPSQSIMYGDQTVDPHNISNVGGVVKWPINAETCRLYWSRMQKDCCTCINVCPYNKPDTQFHRFVRWLTDHARWGDRLYVWGDKSMGYEKTKDPEKFWNEWQPRHR